MSDTTMRIRYIVPVEIGGRRHEPGTYETDVSADEAKELVAAGRAEILGEPLKLSEEERAATPEIGPVVEGEEPTVGVADQPDRSDAAPVEAEHHS